MSNIKPNVLVPRPAFVPLMILGGLVATLLLSALVYLAPEAGLELLDYPRLIGGLFSGDPDVAFWLGYAIFFLAGVFVIPALFSIIWPSLPGPGVGFIAALIKGAIFGVILWVVAGLLLWLLGAVSQLSGGEIEAPGPFALGLGVGEAAGLLIAHVLYGLALALIAAMGQGISPIDTIGWVSYDRGLTDEVAIQRPGEQQG